MQILRSLLNSGVFMVLLVVAVSIYLAYSEQIQSSLEELEVASSNVLSRASDVTSGNTVSTPVESKESVVSIAEPSQSVAPIALVVPAAAEVDASLSNKPTLSEASETPSVVEPQVQSTPAPMPEMSPMPVMSAPAPMPEMSPMPVMSAPAPMPEMSPMPAMSAPAPMPEMSPMPAMSAPAPMPEMSPMPAMSALVPMPEMSPMPAMSALAPMPEMSPMPAMSALVPMPEMSPMPAMSAPAPMPEMSPMPAMSAPELVAPVNSDVLSVLDNARRAFQSGDLEAAEAKYRAILSTTENPDAYGELGNIFFARGQFSDANDAYLKAAEGLIKQNRLLQAQYVIGVLMNSNPEYAQKAMQAFNAKLHPTR